MQPEQVVVAVSGEPNGQELVERARTLAGSAGSVRAVHVSRSGTLAPLDRLEEQRLLVEAAGGSWHALVAEDVGTAVTGFAASVGATSIVMGAPARWRRRDLARQSLAAGLAVHVVSTATRPAARRPRPVVGLSGSRQALGALLGITLLAVGTPVLVALRNGSSLGNELLVYLLGIVLVTLLGGIRPGLATAVISAFAVDWYFVPPLHRLTIRDGTQVFAVVVFVAVALLVSSAVELAARKSREAARAGAEADLLSTLAGSVLRGEGALPALLTRVRESFGADSVSLAELRDGVWADGPSSGTRAPGGSAGLVTLPLGETVRLEVDGPPLNAADQRVLIAFAAHAALLLEQRRIAEVELRAERTSEADRVRSALLAAVSHDLRTPLAAAKTAVSGLLDPAVEWLPSQRVELLETADLSLDRLTRLVEDLLDMSRLQAGVLPVALESVALEDVVVRAIDATADAAETSLDLPDLPAVVADPVLLERVIANLLQNAWRFGGRAPCPPAVSARTDGKWLVCSVIDHGPGIPHDRRDEAFTPFQRLGDRGGAGVGVGLGLAIARGLTTAMGGRLVAHDTPGGGLTMAISLAIVEASR